MSASIANRGFAFELPKLTYVDASLEEPNLRMPARPREPHVLMMCIAAVRAWCNRQAARREAETLSDRMLKDVGLTRGDIRLGYWDERTCSVWTSIWF